MLRISKIISAAAPLALATAMLLPTTAQADATPECNVGAPHSTECGVFSTAPNFGATAVGDSSSATGNFSTAIGTFSTANAELSTATGANSLATGINSSARVGVVGEF